MQNFIDEIKCKIKVIEDCDVIGPEDADFKYGYRRACEDILDDLKNALPDMWVNINGQRSPVERLGKDGEIICAASDFATRFAVNRYLGSGRSPMF
jgi:hypothetical protein